LLEGKKVCLKLVDKEDLGFFLDFWNNIAFYGNFEPIAEQMSKAEAEKYLSDTAKRSCFLIQKKTGKEIGLMVHFGEKSGSVTVGYAIMPSEQSKGYGTEALQLMVDYLFHSKQVNRIKANTDPENLASQRLLEKSGFKHEATTRKSSFVRGEWRDEYRYSMLREEWKESRLLTKPTR
jgi:RimJ/RimL family protein N-acetyltransferase